jgi:hypothetical protein
LRKIKFIQERSVNILDKDGAMRGGAASSVAATANEKGFCMKTTVCVASAGSATIRAESQPIKGTRTWTMQTC